ncbi:hypothetical protein [Stenotrophomonas sp. ESTM1D_MKCIP4_1]|uniref:hypothetical protein n=1 Tax=Stenotrophomonas sp. ESTM1D_MKCIP4_1 TaxID=2072414 RepID=UPI001C1F8583|nr:hypothetical protein [Stenotrophomonas sp. ESTM1D_MKCIP4_1]
MGGLADQLPRGHDQPIGVEAAHLFVRAAFDTRALGGLQNVEQRGEPGQRTAE